MENHLTPMHNLLSHFLDSAKDKQSVPVHIQFQDGDLLAGDLSRGPVKGTFAFASTMRANDDAPEELRRMGPVLVTSYFEPAAIARVMTQVQIEPSRIHRV